MITRYARPQMTSIWEDHRRFEIWLAIEIKACEAWHALGRIPDADLAAIKSRAAFNAERIDEIERTVKHDVIAFLTSVAEHVGDSARYIHMGLTSSDVLDTALAIQMREAGTLILAGLDELLQALKSQALTHARTLIVGRTHGVHAEPTTFGLKLAVFHEELRRGRDRFAGAVREIATGKISGAVGDYLHLDPAVEAHVCRELGLTPATVSNQIIQRDNHGYYLATLALLASSMERLALEIRHLSRTEVLEVQEPFTKGQKGSSAMPHKKNPVTAEQICGLARVLRANAGAAMENIPLWHERDISHSSVERIIIPDSTILMDYITARLTWMVRELVIHPERMRANLELTGGGIYSEGILIALVRSGLTREAAYALVQRNAHRAMETSAPVREALLADPEITGRIGRETVEEAFDPARALAWVDLIMQRVFANG